MSRKRIGGLGWERDLPDFRDCHAGSKAAGEILEKPRALETAQKKLPARIDHSNVEPSAFCYARAQGHRATHYRLDLPVTTPTALFKNIRTGLAADLPSMFGFSVYSSIPAIFDGSGNIPFLTVSDKSRGGHAVITIGHVDTRKIDPHCGALKIRNSRGKEWGENGYGWLPYGHIENEQADDFWSLVDAGFVDTGLFE